MTEYKLIPASSLKNVLALDATLKDCRREIALAEQEGNEMVKAIVTAAAMNTLRQQLSAPEIMKDIKALVGSPLGIEVYPPTAKHGDDVIRDVALEGLLSGARLTGGEIGIHSGKLYRTKKYWERMFRTLPGVVCDEPNLDKPNATKFGEKIYASVEGTLTWRVNGKADKLEFKGQGAILVLWNSGMGIEAVHGKAKRVAYRAAYAKVTNQQIEEDAADVVTVESPAGFHEVIHTEPTAAYTVEPAPEAPTEPAGELPIGCEVELSRCETWTDADKCVAAWMEHAKPEDVPHIKLAGDKRKAELKAARGERSNKRGTLLDKGPPSE